MSTPTLSGVADSVTTLLKLFPSKIRNRIYSVIAVAGLVIGLVSAVLQPLGHLTIQGFDVAVLLPYLSVAGGFAALLGKVHLSADKPAEDNGADA